MCSAVGGAIERHAIAGGALPERLSPWRRSKQQSSPTWRTSGMAWCTCSPVVSTVSPPSSPARSTLITVKIVHADSATRVGEASGQFHSGDTSKLGPGEPMLLPLVVPLKGINLPMYGPYDIHVSVNGEPQQLLTFRALAPRR